MAGCRSLDTNEIELVKNNLDITRNKLMFVLGLKSGFRITELLSLCIKDVSLDGIPNDRVKVSRKSMKGKSTSREVLLHDEVKAVIKEYVNTLGCYSPNDPLFKSRQGENKPISRKQAWLILKEAYKEVGLKGSTGTHSARKSFARSVYEASGHDIVLTQKAIGHASIVTTIKYLDIKQDEVDEVIRKLK
jgi:integrase